MPKLIDQLKKQFPNFILSAHADCGDETVTVSRENLKTLVRFIKTDPNWDMNVLIDLTAVDYLLVGRATRFEVVYHFYSVNFQHRLRVKVPLSEKDAECETLSDLWPIANWLEREVWDMFGIQFRNHPNMRRLLMYEEFEGHPLRKDYPYTKRQPLVGPPDAPQEKFPGRNL